MPYQRKFMHLWMQARKAYGVGAYIYQGRQPSLISETCVVLINESTLPKLTLMTAVMHQTVKFTLLTPQYSENPVFLWSDSQMYYTGYSTRESYNLLFPAIYKKLTTLFQLTREDITLQEIM